jgi:hypothetical protein
MADLSNAIAVAVDNAALNGSGTAPQPLGLLNVPANASGSYVYADRSATVTFGGPASWASVLAFEKVLEAGLIQNDGTFGYATDPSVRDKWQQVPKLAEYPSFLWENIPDDATFGRDLAPYLLLIIDPAAGGSHRPDRCPPVSRKNIELVLNGCPGARQLFAA